MNILSIVSGVIVFCLFIAFLFIQALKSKTVRN